MASSTKSSSTYPELSTPPHLQSGSSPTDCSPFAEADQAISELIRAMEPPSSVLSESAVPRPTPKSVLVFRGKPLEVNLYQPKRRRIAKLPKPQSSGSRKPRNGDLKRDAKGQFAILKSTPPARAPETSTLDTTRTPAPSDQIVTEPVSPPESADITPNQVIADAPTAPQAVVLDVNSPLIPSLSFPMPTAEELASFLYSNYIVPKISEHSSFFLCREQFYHQYYHAHLITFFKSNLGTTCISYSQVDTMILAALHLLGFD